jgi:hypothetical protein
MIADTDYVGLGTLISAIGATIVSIIVALRQQGTKDAVREVHDAVKTANGQTLGELADAGELRRIEQAIQETKPPDGT